MGHWRLMRNAAHQRYSADHGQLGTSLPMLNLVAIVVKEYEPAIGFSSAPRFASSLRILCPGPRFDFPADRRIFGNSAVQVVLSC